MKKVTTLIARNREFYIVKDENGYWGIESKYFVNGVLTKKFNGINGHLGKTVEETLKRTHDTIEIDYLVNECGMDLMDAMKAHFNF